MKENHLLLIDGTNILRRCYEANPADDSSEKAEGAVRSALGSLKKGLRRHNPTHVFVAYDMPNGKTWRHEAYHGYKASRKPTPEFLAKLVPQMIEQTNALGMYACAVPGYEAEDLLARVGRTWVERTVAPVTVLSTDKDLLLLVNEGILVHAHFEDVWRDGAWIEAKFGVSAGDLLTYFSLIGDSVDDIPGVAGIGPKTAVKLVNEFHSLEEIYAALRDGRISAKGIKANLGAAEKEAFISRELLSFKAPELKLTFADLRYGEVVTG